MTKSSALTALQTLVLQTILNSEFQDGANPVGKLIRVQHINPFGSDAVAALKLRGVLCSLSNRDLVKTSFDVEKQALVELTAAGVAILGGPAPKAKAAPKKAKAAAPAPAPAPVPTPAPAPVAAAPAKKAKTPAAVQAEIVEILAAPTVKKTRRVPPVKLTVHGQNARA